ncbi:MAG TPA: NBR1-Ig-like domain-containing protein [Anaerolineales bacterium]|nr:NBR1-Ig-like domain-containing protein [Anaerolineales bacterium]
MRNTSNRGWQPTLLISMAAALLLSACNLGQADATPTMSVDAIYTSAFFTLEAQRATELALTPSATATKLATPTVASPTSATLSTLGSATSSAGGAQGCDNSTYVSDVTIPDGTVLAPGKNFVKTWTVMNNGTCAWTTSYKLVFISGESMGGASVPVPSAVPAGQQGQLSVSLIAPANAGDYTGWWRLQNAAGQYFGNSISVVIKVSGGGIVSTSTPGAPAASETPAAAPTTGTP